MSTIEISQAEIKNELIRAVFDRFEGKTNSDILDELNLDITELIDNYIETLTVRQLLNVLNGDKP